MVMNRYPTSTSRGPILGHHLKTFPRERLQSFWALGSISAGRPAPHGAVLPRPSAGLIGHHVADDLAHLEGCGVGADIDLPTRSVGIEHVLHGLQDSLNAPVVVGEDRLEHFSSLLTDREVSA